MSSEKRPPFSTETSGFSEFDTLTALKEEKKPYQLFSMEPSSTESMTPSNVDNFRRTRRFILTRRVIWSALVALVVLAVFLAILLSLLRRTVNRLQIPQLGNGMSEILQTYQPPSLTRPASPTWLKDFSTGILPLQCHSHNDYWHRVPLYEGLSAGCVSTEADIWLGNTTDGKAELFIGHDSRALNPSRTLRSLYLDPLVDILTKQNEVLSTNLTTPGDSQTSNDTTPVGVFSMSPNTSLVLLLDFKTSNTETWDAVLSQLADLRALGWLTHWTPTTSIVQRPLTIVASGKAPFSLIDANTTYRDIFYDAPLAQLSLSLYNSNNSYYASAPLKGAVGALRLGKLSVNQKSLIVEQISKAKEMGLKSRYWDLPKWPVLRRNYIWKVLVDRGVGALNVDDLVAASVWERKRCVLGGKDTCYP